MKTYFSDCTNIYNDPTEGYETIALACKNCVHKKITDMGPPIKDKTGKYITCPQNSIENFQVFGKDSNNNSSVKIIIIISVIAILCVLGFLGYRHMNKKK